MTESDKSPAAHPAANIEAVLKAALEVLEDKKAEDINVLPVKEFATLFDYFVVATCSSGRQMHATASDLDMKVKPLGLNALVQGDATSDWVLIDLGDVIVHLFKPEARSFYDLDSMWKAAAGHKSAQQL